jgi:hypothetical protein
MGVPLPSGSRLGACWVRVTIQNHDIKTATEEETKTVILIMPQVQIRSLVRDIRIAAQQALQTDASHAAEQLQGSDQRRYHSVSAAEMQQRIDDPNDDAPQAYCVECKEPKKWNACDKCPAGGKWA